MSSNKKNGKSPMKAKYATKSTKGAKSLIAGDINNFATAGNAGTAFGCLKASGKTGAGLRHDALDPAPSDAVLLGAMAPQGPSGAYAAALMDNDDSVASSGFEVHLVTDVPFQEKSGVAGTTHELDVSVTGDLLKPVLVMNPPISDEDDTAFNGCIYLQEEFSENALYQSVPGFQPTNGTMRMTLPAGFTGEFFLCGTLSINDDGGTQIAKSPCRITDDGRSPIWPFDAGTNLQSTWSISYNIENGLAAGDTMTVYLEAKNPAGDWQVYKTYSIPTGVQSGTVSGGAGQLSNVFGLRLRATATVSKVTAINQVVFDQGDATFADLELPSTEGKQLTFGRQLDEILPLINNLRIVGRSALVTYIGGANVAGTAIGVWSKGDDGIEAADYETLSTKNDIHLFTRATGAYTYSRIMPNDCIWRQDVSQNLSDNRCRIVARAAMPSGESATLRIAVCFRIQFTTSSPIFQDFQGLVNTSAEERSRLLAYLERVPNWFENPDHVKAIRGFIKNYVEKWLTKRDYHQNGSNVLFSDLGSLLDYGIDLLVTLL
jgi:hypothetical protein